MRIGGGRVAADPGEFNGVRLAQQHAAGLAQKAHAGGVLLGPAALVARRVALRGQVHGIDHVLDRERQPVQYAARPAQFALPVSRARLAQRPLGVEGRERPHFLLAPPVARNATLDRLLA